MTTAYERSYDHSERVMERIRRCLKERATQTCIVSTCGSYARREASGTSDLDYLILSEDKDESEAEALRKDMAALISEVGARPPAAGGPFDKRTSPSEMVENIGGEEDSNSSITRRVLLLLEGEWLLNESGFHALRRRVLERYIQDTARKEHLAMFLLNDVIRYYRTIAVDYEFKTSGSAATKPWATRLLKLVFSRKLLYASGLFSIAKTYGEERQRKIDILDELFSQPVIERMNAICGKHEMQPIVDSYNQFLEPLADREKRDHLEGLGRECRDDPVYREIKDEGRRFTSGLVELFHSTFPRDHPIHLGVVF